DFFGIQGFFKDFNNDGYIDLMVSGNEHYIFYNNGDGTFQNALNPFNSDQIHSFSVGDINHDGFLDIYAGYGFNLNDPSPTKKDRIWLNQGNSNNFLNIQLKGTESNINGIGARVELHGSWGIQIRDVRSGEGYGLVNSFTQHFGIGVSTQVDKVVVRWPSGIVNEILNPAINQFLVITEDPVKAYIFNDNVWLPSDPNNESSYNDTIIVEAGAAEISSNTISEVVIIEAGAALTVDPSVTLSAETLTLKSTSQLYSSLIVHGSFTGTINYERHVNINGSGETGSNDLISSPVLGESFEDFVSNNPNLFSNPSNTTEKLFGPFDKTTGSYLTWDINVPAEAAEILAPGVGYRAASSDNDTFTFTGTVNNDVVSHNIINSGATGAQWNLVGNPYPSYLNVQAFLNHEVSPGITNLDLMNTDTAAIYGYDGSAQDGWTIYNLATTTPSSLIAPGQGFFVSANPTNAPLYDLEFTPAMRTTGASDDFILGDTFIAGKSQDEALSVVSELSLSNNTKSYSTRIYFIEGTTRGLDKGFDASVYGGVADDFLIFTHLVEDHQGLDFAIQALPYIDFNDVVIPLGVKAQEGTSLTISIGENSTLSNNVNVYLEDTLLNTLTLLNDSDYVFTPTIDLVGTGRFFLRYSNETLSAPVFGIDDILIYSNNARSEIIIKGQLSEYNNVNIYDIHGRLVNNKTLDSSNLINTVNVNTLSSGIYIVQLSNGSAIKTQKIIIN
ncbi:MAG: ASPIC/UnbV domain-containing protein, partial [Flavobacteriaceae bacterium]|nr:ASPIC/UnbV domain-containing protein [Flavobacteriaceae bacterium]